MEQRRSSLSEQEKIEIISMYNGGVKSVRKIGETINKPKSTVESFLKSYHKFGTISPKRGRKAIITEDLKQSVARDLVSDPFLPLTDQTQNYPVSRETIRKIRHEEKFNYYNMTPTCQLTQQHIEARLRYCRFVVERPLIPIVFTDESTVEVNLSKPGIWRRRGHYPPGMLLCKGCSSSSCDGMGRNRPQWFQNKPYPLFKIRNGRNLLSVSC